MPKLAILLAKEALRQAACELLNRHRATPNKRDIVLVGSRRSGSTLLMQVLAQAKGLKGIDQPFSIYTASSAQMRHLPWPAGGLFVAPDAEERWALRRYLADIRSGALHLREQWRPWAPDFHFRSDRVVLKTTDAHYLTDLFVDAGLQVILYFRHPIPQAISCARNQWGDKVSHFAAHHHIRTRSLTPTQNALLDRVAESGTQMERYVLGWCLENLPLFEARQQGLPVVFYEQMVLDPDSILDRLAQACDVQVTQKMRLAVRRSSRSVPKLSDPAAIEAIRGGDYEALVGRWRKAVSGGDIERVNEILSKFPGCPYVGNSPLPETSECKPRHDLYL